MVGCCSACLSAAIVVCLLSIFVRQVRSACGSVSSSLFAPRAVPRWPRWCDGAMARSSVASLPSSVDGGAMVGPLRWYDGRILLPLCLYPLRWLRVFIIFIVRLLFQNLCCSWSTSRSQTILKYHSSLRSPTPVKKMPPSEKSAMQSPGKAARESYRWNGYTPNMWELLRASIGTTLLLWEPTC